MDGPPTTASGSRIQQKGDVYSETSLIQIPMGKKKSVCISEVSLFQGMNACKGGVLFTHFRSVLICSVDSFPNML